MKFFQKSFKFLVFLFILVLLVACKEEIKITIETNAEIEVELGDATFDFLPYIIIKNGNKELSLENISINIDNVDFNMAGVYEIIVSFSYQNKNYQETIEITIIDSIIEMDIVITATEDIKVPLGSNDFDFKEYIIITCNDEELDKTSAIINCSDVNFDVLGNYEITVSYVYLGVTYSDNIEIEVIDSIVEINFSISTTEPIIVEVGNTTFDFKSYLVIEDGEKVLSSDLAIINSNGVDFNNSGNYNIIVSYDYKGNVYYENISITVKRTISTDKTEELVMTFNLANNTYGKESSGIVITEYVENEVYFDGSNIYKTEDTEGAIRIGSGANGGNLTAVIDLPKAINKVVINAKAYSGSVDKPNINLYIEDMSGKVLVDKKTTPDAQYTDYIFFMKNNNAQRIYFEISNDDYERFLLNTIKFYYSTLNELSQEEKDLINQAASKDYSNMTIKENFTGDTFYLAGNIIKSFVYIENESYPTYLIKNGSTYNYYNEDGAKSVWQSWTVSEYIPIIQFNKINSDIVYKEENGFTVYYDDLPGSFFLFVTMVKNIELISLTFTINGAGYIDSMKVYTRLNGKHYSGTFNFSQIGTTVITDYPKY